MKVSDAIAQWLSQQVRHVFTVSGGANLHIIDSIARTEGIQNICTQTEVCAGFAADAYARVNGMGCALTTSGPGATNLVTPIATAYYDSVPVLYITGQQTRARLKGSSKVRQIGFQETPIVDIVKPITKYAALVMEPQAVIAELQMAISIAKARRPGPVLIDIPDDVARAAI